MGNSTYGDYGIDKRDRPEFGQMTEIELAGVKLVIRIWSTGKTEVFHKGKLKAAFLTKGD